MSKPILWVKYAAFFAHEQMNVRQDQAWIMSTILQPFDVGQELRDYLHKHRQWLAGLLAGSSSAGSQEGYSKQAALLCSLYSALLKCSEFEVRTTFLELFHFKIDLLGIKKDEILALSQRRHFKH